MRERYLTTLNDARQYASEMCECLSGVHPDKYDDLVDKVGEWLWDNLPRRSSDHSRVISSDTDIPEDFWEMEIFDGFWKNQQ